MGYAELFSFGDDDLILVDTGFRMQVLMEPSSLGDTAQDGLRGAHTFKCPLAVPRVSLGVCRESLAGSRERRQNVISLLLSKLDEQMVRFQFPALGSHLTVFAQGHAGEYADVNVEGPFRSRQRCRHSSKSK